jgi:hypothetical protein
VTKLGAGKLGFDFWQTEKEISPSKSPDCLWSPVSLIFNWNGTCSQRLKWLGHQVHSLLPSSAEVKKEVCCSSSPLYTSCREEGTYFGLTSI